MPSDVIRHRSGGLGAKLSFDRDGVAYWRRWKIIKGLGCYKILHTEWEVDKVIQTLQEVRASLPGFDRVLHVEELLACGFYETDARRKAREAAKSPEQKLQEATRFVLNRLQGMLEDNIATTEELKTELKSNSFHYILGRYGWKCLIADFQAPIIRHLVLCQSAEIRRELEDACRGLQNDLVKSRLHSSPGAVERLLNDAYYEAEAQLYDKLRALLHMYEGIDA